MKFLTTVVCAFVLTVIQSSATAASTENKIQLDEPPVEDNPDQAAAVSNDPSGLKVEGNVPTDESPDQRDWPPEPKNGSQKLAPLQSNVLSMRKQATSDSEAAVEMAELERQKAYEKVAAMLEGAQRERNQALKIVQDRLARDHAIASTIWKQAMRTWTESRREAARQYQQAATVADQSLREAEKESLSIVEAGEDEFVRKYRQLEEHKRNVVNEHREELEKAQRAREAAFESAKEGREKAEAEFAKARRQRRVSAEQKAQMKAKLAGELEKCEDTLESADAEWRRVLDSLGIGEEYEGAVDRAFQEFQEGREKADSILQKAGQEFNHALRTAERQRKEIEAMADAERAKAKAEAWGIEGKIKSQRIALMKAPLRKWRKVQNLANQEKQKAEEVFRDTIARMNTEVTRASFMAEDMESGLKSPAGPEDEKPGGGNPQKPITHYLEDEEFEDDEEFF